MGSKGSDKGEDGKCDTYEDAAMLTSVAEQRLAELREIIRMYKAEFTVHAEQIFSDTVRVRI